MRIIYIALKTISSVIGACFFFFFFFFSFMLAFVGKKDKEAKKGLERKRTTTEHPTLTTTWFRTPTQLQNLLVTWFSHIQFL